MDSNTLQYIFDIDPAGRKLFHLTDWTLSYDFPLYVGKKWEKMVSGKDAASNPRNYLYTYKILSFENISVPAGTFKSFKIELKQKDYVTDSEITYYIWFSPEIKREVKFQYGTIYGRVRISKQNYELKSFKFGSKTNRNGLF